MTFHLKIKSNKNTFFKEKEVLVLVECLEVFSAAMMLCYNLACHLHHEVNHDLLYITSLGCYGVCTMFEQFYNSFWLLPVCDQEASKSLSVYPKNVFNSLFGPG